LAHVDELRTPGGVRVERRALRFEFARSGGPGGQHVNTSATKVTAVLDVSAGLRGRAAQRVREKHGPTLRSTSSAHRSQARNRAAALERLLRRIDDALREEPPRTKTRIPSREKRRRREDKGRRSRRLADRRVPPE
jgi:ribosome-associated protein